MLYAPKSLGPFASRLIIEELIFRQVLFEPQNPFICSILHIQCSTVYTTKKATCQS